MINPALNLQNNYYIKPVASKKTETKAKNRLYKDSCNPLHLSPAYHRAQVLPFKGEESSGWLFSLLRGRKKSTEKEINVGQNKVNSTPAHKSSQAEPSKKPGPSRETLEFIKNYRDKFGRKLNSLRQLNPSELSTISDIAAGIDIFEDWSAHDIKFVSSIMDSILLQRGCPHRCAHCGADSEPKITSMNWENFTALANGMGELKDRLGFNPFCLGSTEISNSVVYPFLDSDPIFFKSPKKTLDSDGKQTVKYHDIHDAAKLFYEKTGTRFFLTTAGWSPSNKFAQTAAEKIADNSENFLDITISVHPFHHYFNEAREYEREAAKENNSEKKSRLQAKAWEKREQYYEMMANVFYTFMPQLKDKKAAILFMNFPRDVKDEFQQNDRQINILENIKSRLKEKLSEKGENEKIKGVNDTIDRVTHFRTIDYIGRAADLAPPSAVIENDKKKEDYNETDLYKLPKRISPDGSILLNMGRMADIKFNPVKLTGKKLNLPDPQAIKTQRNIPEHPWPDENYLLSLNK